MTNANIFGLDIIVDKGKANCLRHFAVVSRGERHDAGCIDRTSERGTS